MASKKRMNEDLNRFNKIMGYDPSNGGVINEAKSRRTYLVEEDPEEVDQESEKSGNADFDFGDEGSPEGGEEGGDFDFGGEDAESGEDFGGGEEGGDFDFGGEEPEGEEDEFGTASEFSAVDDVELEDEVEEIDVTAIVTKSEEAKELAQQAVNVGNENGEFLKSLTDKLTNLESQLTKMDTIASKISKLEANNKTPEEKLELRSLDSYPFNQKLSDYWEDKAAEDDNYRISTGESTSDGETKEYVLKPEDINDFDEVSVKDSFNPANEKPSGEDIDVYKRR